MKLRLRIASFSAPLIALAISFGLSSLILLFIGKDPIETFQIMFEYGTKGKSIVSIINRSIPLYISAIAVAVGFKMGLFNIGVDVITSGNHVWDKQEITKFIKNEEIVICGLLR